MGALSLAVIRSELDRELSIYRETEQRIAQYRQGLDQQTALLLETSGKVKGYRELLRKAEEPSASGAGAESLESSSDGCENSGDCGSSPQ